VKSLTASCLAEAFEADRAEARPELLGAFDDALERDIRRWIEIEYQTAGRLRLERLTVPRM
jgi:hypothetical protein